MAERRDRQKTVYTAKSGTAYRVERGQVITDRQAVNNNVSVKKPRAGYYYDYSLLLSLIHIF